MTVKPKRKVVRMITTERWATVNQVTGQCAYVNPPRKSKRDAQWACWPNERIARVKIREISDD